MLVLKLMTAAWFVPFAAFYVSRMVDIPTYSTLGDICVLAGMATSLLAATCGPWLLEAGAGRLFLVWGPLHQGSVALVFARYPLHGVQIGGFTLEAYHALAGLGITFMLLCFWLAGEGTAAPARRRRPSPSRRPPGRTSWSPQSSRAL